MSSGRPMTLALGRQLADHLITLLAPVCERIEIAGSIRRGQREVHDIELVAIPRLVQHGGQLDLFGGVTNAKINSLLDEKLDLLLISDFIVKRPHLSTSDFITAWGAKYKKFLVARDGKAITRLSTLVQVDLYITTAPQWGSIFTIRTGPAEFGHALVTYIKNHTPYRQQDGGLIDIRTGTFVPTPEEQDYFAAVGLRYVPPEKRNSHTIVPDLPQWKRAEIGKKSEPPAQAPKNQPEREPTAPALESESPTIVVNVGGDRSRCDVYIGRPSKWGNPFVIGRDGTREEVIVQYEAWIQTQPLLLAALGELQGKRLGCYCAPLPCHGDVLARLADRRENHTVYNDSVESAGGEQVSEQTAGESGMVYTDDVSVRAAIRQRLETVLEV